LSLIEFINISKKFAGVSANDNINLQIQQGEIHAIVGENGAGKTTLMKILYGMYKPDTGSIIINEKEINLINPSKAIESGIGMVHQHFMLIPTMTVLENIILGYENSSKIGTINFENCRKYVNEIIKPLGIKFNLNEKVINLPLSQQQKLEIIKLLYRKSNILILDEPTAVLTPQEIDDLFSTLKELKETGKTILIITHKLKEIFDISDRVSVLRHGKLIGTKLTEKTNVQELSNMITGEDTITKLVQKTPPKENILLTVKSVSIQNNKKSDVIKNISINIKSGEILGLAGIEGNGQKELVETLIGIRKIKNGSINFGNNEKSNSVSHITDDRHKYGIILDYNLQENLILGRQREKKIQKNNIFNKNYIKKFADNILQGFDVRPANSELKGRNLSGGNQQKLVIGRELTKNCDVLVINQPTRGLDIKASNFVHDTILEERTKGKAILLISSDLTELIKLSDRIAVLTNGSIRIILNSAETSERELGEFMIGIR
jgi:general nucleoside transport system ATP-binding protein